MSPPAAPILVSGATGYIGGRLVPELLDLGHEVRALARRPGKLAGRWWAGQPGLEVIEGDVTDAASLAPALEGVRAAYYLVHSMREGSDYAERDEQAARTFAGACEAAGVERIIYLSGLGEDEHGLSEHLQSRHDTGDALRSSSVPVTELRAGIVVGSGSLSFEIIYDLASRLPAMIAPRWIESRCEPIAIRDVLGYLVGALDAPGVAGGVFHVGNGEVFTYRRMLEICGEELGHRPRIMTVPVLSPKLSSYWLHLVTRVDMSVAGPLVEGMRNDAITRDSRIRELIPLDLTGYREAVRLALARMREDRRHSRWTDAGVIPAVGLARELASPIAGPPHRDYRVFDSKLPADELFARLRLIGGDSGYGRGTGMLWRLRGAIDRMVGGPGMRRGRPLGPLTDGDYVDFWRVDLLRPAPARALRLVAEMRVPGTATLDFRVEELPEGGSRLHQLAELSNIGYVSGLYWGAVAPLHGLVFDRLGEDLTENDEAARQAHVPNAPRRTSDAGVASR